MDVRVPDLIGATAEVRESYDEKTGRFRIRVRVVNRYVGPLFGYEGSLHRVVRRRPRAGVRPGLRPVREEARA